MAGFAEGLKSMGLLTDIDNLELGHLSDVDCRAELNAIQAAAAKHLVEVEEAIKAADEEKIIGSDAEMLFLGILRDLR